ncbi:hypothetical protein FHQ18_00080 [Deferribacter autotrophicus]|uniref:Uncharacterized protein n=1 Tax=Deferribacter autotrophicus TaxID=500465 RepID=A0A5A8F6Y2_9BACT|nr:hypothetical protein [Deferribacter autotrophicus]KAA0259313.1 hypothetical protein FHQ18_00080 [Deferribacter autotrophicus]
MLNKVVLTFEKSEHFPVFIDYDFKLQRCRGYSLRIDFMYRGVLTDFIKTVNHKNGFLFIKKSPFFLTQGFFLYDFSLILENIELFLETINKLNFSEIIMEKSKILNDSIYEKMNNNVNVTLLELV